MKSSFKSHRKERQQNSNMGGYDMKKINNEFTLRIKNKDVLDRLQEMFEKSKFRYATDFMNYLLEEAAFRTANTEETLDTLNKHDEYLKAIWEKVKDIDKAVSR